MKLRPVSLVVCVLLIATNAPAQVHFFRDCPDCPEMVVVPAGSFEMGAELDEALAAGSPPEWAQDETPVHTVTFPRAFAVGRFQITKAQFGAFVADSGYRPGKNCRTHTDGEFREVAEHDWSFTGSKYPDDHPVHCITWHDAKAYANWLAERTGRDYRLLSEAEWEYAARAGASGPRYWRTDLSPCEHGTFGDLTSHEMFADSSLLPPFQCRDGFEKTAPVGSFASNSFGLYDMLGNVWEWLEDCYNPSYKNAPEDGRAWLDGDCDKRMLRGGGWEDPPAFTRLANRLAMPADRRVESGGFRVGLSLHE